MYRQLVYKHTIGQGIHPSIKAKAEQSVGGEAPTNGSGRVTKRKTDISSKTQCRRFCKSENSRVTVKAKGTAKPIK